MVGARLRRVRAITVLIIFMVATGVVTTVAAINTSEVIFQADTGLSDVITTVALTRDGVFNKELISRYQASYRPGYFGTPKKIKFPESNVSYNIVNARLENGTWKATKGVAHEFLIGDPAQKVFGNALIYMRTNTPTTQNIGSIMSGDLLDVVTSDGWQLGYKVEHVAADPSELPGVAPTHSTITIVLIDDATGKTQSVNASLFKVGERQ